MVGETTERGGRRGIALFSHQIPKLPSCIKRGDDDFSGTKNGVVARGCSDRCSHCIDHGRHLDCDGLHRPFFACESYHMIVSFGTFALGSEIAAEVRGD